MAIYYRSKTRENKLTYPVEIDYMPDVNNLKKIKNKIYEGYVPISEETLLKDFAITDLVQYKIAEFRKRNFFVKRIYTKYLVVPSGVAILAFELVRLREPIIERLLK